MKYIRPDFPCTCKHPAAVHSGTGCQIRHRNGMCSCRARFGKTSSDDYDLELCHKIENEKLEAEHASRS